MRALTPTSTLIGAVIASALIASAALLLAAASHAGATVHILVFMENGVGNAAQAQPHIDELMESAKKSNGWASAEGKYVTRRSSADGYIKDKKPELGFISLGAYLSLRKPQSLEVLGVADVARAGGRQYFLVSKSAGSLAGCRGKKMATNHADDPRFIDKVASGGAFTLADFTLVETRRPVQTIKKVLKGEATCALIDDAQLEELAHIDGASALKPAWASAKLPPMAVVAFSGAPSAMRAKFKASLGSLCSGDGKNTCDKVGIRSVKAAGEEVYSAQIAAYDK